MAYDSTSWTSDSKTTGGTSDTTTVISYSNAKYAYFGIGAQEFSHISPDTHYPVPFVTNAVGSSTQQNNATFGTSTDPSTSFTCADGDNHASGLVTMLWYLPDKIYVDSVTSLEGAENDHSGGSLTTRMHLMSYTFSQSSNTLTSGALVAYSADVTNAGNEQVYKPTWTVSSPEVDADKALLAFFRVDTSAEDFALTVTVKYHLI